ncbi:MAG: hypothetical protein ACOX75_00070 [Lachnospiraceae bacterium]|jgi:hypothetical protein
MKNKAIRILQIHIGGKLFTGVISYLYHQYKYVDKSKANYDFLSFRKNPLETMSEDPVFKDSSFFAFNAVKPSSGTTNRMLSAKKEKQIGAENVRLWKSYSIGRGFE